NGYADHCHCVISLEVDQTIQKLVQLIKGESSFWINNKSGFEFPPGKRFEWQDEYFAVSVSQGL
ncbi:MAG: IS200/IS605 family transposase, partial [Daejeonella sp.]